MECRKSSRAVERRKGRRGVADITRLIESDFLKIGVSSSSSLSSSSKEIAAICPTSGSSPLNLEILQILNSYATRYNIIISYCRVHEGYGKGVLRGEFTQSTHSDYNSANYR